MVDAGNKDPSIRLKQLDCYVFCNFANGIICIRGWGWGVSCSLTLFLQSCSKTRTNIKSINYEFSKPDTIANENYAMSEAYLEDSSSPLSSVGKTRMFSRNIFSHKNANKTKFCTGSQNLK